MSGSRTGTLQHAWVLHHRAYRDSSLIVELFTLHNGRVGAVARGARRANSRLRGLLQPFAPLLVSFAGRGDLRTLTQAEAGGPAVALQGEALLAGFYVNELLLRLLVRDDSHEVLWGAYGQTLEALRDGDTAASLRRFEHTLLGELGYGLNLQHDIVADAPLQPDARYEYVLEQGPRPLSGHGGGALCFPGQVLLDMHAGRYDSAATRRAARTLFAAALDLYLGGQPLRSRAVLAALRRLDDDPGPSQRVADGD